MIKKLLIALPLIGLGILAFANTAFAAGQYDCQTPYSQQCQPVELMVKKTVKNPSTGVFVENLTKDPREVYAPNSIVPFKITVTNFTNASISAVTVKDTLPEHTTFASGPGVYDTASNTLTFTLNDLKANEPRDTDIQVRVLDGSQLPTTTDPICVTNRATATGNNVTKNADSQFCIEQPGIGSTVPGVTKGGNPMETKGGKKIFPEPVTQKTPSTGPEALALIPLIGSGLSGLILRRKANK